MEIQLVARQIIILSIIIGIGVIAGKLGYITKQGEKSLASVLMYIAMPMKILSSYFFEFSNEKAFNGLLILGFSFVYFFIGFGLTGLFFKYADDSKRPIMRYCCIFSNCGFMGLPILSALLSKEGVFYGSILNIVFSIAMWSVGVIAFSGKADRKGILKVFVKPALLATYLGMIMFITGIRFPEPVNATIDSLGEMIMPLAMLITGAALSHAKLKDFIYDWKAYYVSFIRLIIVPGIVLVVVKALKLPEIISIVLLIQTAMPVGATTAVLSEMFGKDSAFASRCISISTALSMVTIPVILQLL